MPEKFAGKYIGDREGAKSAMCLRAYYAMSGTDLEHGATCLRACYAMSGTDPASAGTLSCYARAKRCPVLT
eukprot:1694000-Rhodomonas_salina.2